MKLLIKAPLLLGFLILSSCGPKTEEAIYYDRLPPEFSLEGKSWDSSEFPIILNVPLDFNPFNNALIMATEQWNQALGTKVFEIHYGTTNTQWTKATDPVMDSISGIYQQFFWEFPTLDYSVLAYTTNLSQGSRIKQADIIFNFSYYNFADADSPPRQFGENYIDFESVLVHELGHFLGLSHSKIGEDENSVMLPTLRKGEKRRNLSDQDILNVRSLYFTL